MLPPDEMMDPLLPPPALPLPLDPEALRLLGEKRQRAAVVPRERRIFVNRNLRMDQVELVGFDMDYTLATYSLHEVEQLSFDLTLRKLVSDFGYPEEILEIGYDREFVMRGLVIDKKYGNLLKLDRFNYVGRAFHGRRPLEKSERLKLYRSEKILLSSQRYAWVDTLFALPEASIYAETIERLEGRHPLPFGKLYDDIREAIDTVHRDGSLKSLIQSRIDRYVVQDPDLGPALHKLRSAGKKLFLLTNSLWPYTQAVMSHLLDRKLPEYPTWRNYFDFVVVGGSKPAFFSERRPFLELDHTGAVQGEASRIEKGGIYQGGNLADFERMSGFKGDQVLYVGDHIFGDILKSKKASLWRTCMVVEELERELEHLDAHSATLRRLGALERLRVTLEDELARRKARLTSAERQPDEEREAEKKENKIAVEVLRRAAHQVLHAIQEDARSLEDGYNPHWGLMFKEGNENSRFGEQVEDYACLYTSRVSNFLFTSPMQYFRSSRALMPHEVGTEALSPFGGDDRTPGDTVGRHWR